MNPNLISPTDIIIIIGLIAFMVMVAVMFMILYHKISLATDALVGSKNKATLRHIIQFEKAIDKILLQLRFELNATDVFVARFHNGGNFNNGIRMKKFSIPYGKASSTVKELVRWRFYDKFCSHWPDAIDQLLTLGEYCVANLDNCNDMNFKRDMEFYGFKSCNLFLLEQADLSHSPEGFLSINFNTSKVLNQEERDRIKEESDHLVSLMNLIPIDIGVTSKKKIINTF
jgi:hypothetical protein